MVIPEYPAQDLQPVTVRSAAEPAGPLDDMVLDRTGLAQDQVSVNHDRNLAHGIETTELGAPGLAIEEVHEYRLPVHSRKFHRQGSLVGVAAFTKTIEINRHALPSRH